MQQAATTDPVMAADARTAQALAGFPPAQIETQRGRLAYREVGAGPPLVLLHGIGSSSGAWLNQFRSLAHRFRLIAWDAPGYGGSDDLPTETPRPTDYVASLKALTDSLIDGPFALVGHSLGALIAAAFARRHPDGVSRLLLAAPARGYAREGEDVRNRKWRERSAMLSELGGDELALRRGPALLDPEAGDEAVALARWSMRRLRPAGYAAAAHCLAHGDILRDVAALHLPVRVLCGASDTVTPPAGCRQVAAALPGSDYVEVPAAGHLLYADQPQAFDEFLIRFLSNPT